MPCDLTAIDMQDFTSDEVRIFQIENRLDDVGDLAHAIKGMQTGQRHKASGRVHRRLDHARGHRVYADIAGRVLDRKAPRGRGKAAFGQRGKDRRHRRIGVLDECGRDLYHMARLLLYHCIDSLLRDVEKPIQVRRKQILVLLIGVLGELVGNENSRVVDQRIDRPKRDSAASITFLPVAGSPMSPAKVR